MFVLRLSLRPYATIQNSQLIVIQTLRTHAVSGDGVPGVPPGLSLFIFHRLLGLQRRV